MSNGRDKEGSGGADLLREIIKLKALKLGYAILTLVSVAVVKAIQVYFGISLEGLLNLISV